MTNLRLCQEFERFCWWWSDNINLGKKKYKTTIAVCLVKAVAEATYFPHILHLNNIFPRLFAGNLLLLFIQGYESQNRFLPGDRFYSVWNGAYMEIEGRNEISTFVPMCGQVQMSWAVSGGKLQKSFGLKYDSFLLGPENTLNLPAWDKACWTCYVLILAFIILIHWFLLKKLWNFWNV